MILAEMTSPEIDALPRDIVVLMPVASCEQHSLHLPVFTDSMIGGEVALRTHRLVPDDVLILPVQWLGYSQHHIRYPGTLSAISETPFGTDDGYCRLNGRIRFLRNFLSKIATAATGPIFRCYCNA